MCRQKMCWNVQARGMCTGPLYLINPQPVHTYAFSLENATFSLRIPFRPLVYDENDRWKRNFSKTLSTLELFWKRRFRVYVWTDENGTFRKRWGHTISFNRRCAILQNLFKMVDERFPFLSFILRLISNLIACFQANWALLILQADYSRRRQNIIRLLSMPLSRGGRLDLPSVWLCFCPDFDIF